MSRFQNGTVIVLTKRHSTTWLVAVLQLQVEQGMSQKLHLQSRCQLVENSEVLEKNHLPLSVV